MASNSFTGLYLMSGQLDAGKNIVDGSMFPLFDVMIAVGAGSDFRVFESNSTGLLCNISSDSETKIGLLPAQFKSNVIETLFKFIREWLKKLDKKYLMGEN